MLGMGFGWGSSSGSNKRQFEHQVNDSLFELHKPEGTPSMEIVLFHGLNLGESSDAHLSTWEAEDGSIWPKKWLVEEYPAAHIFTVSYSGTVVKTSYEKFDMSIIVESLISDLRDANIGQTPHCPVVLVGHSFGGLVIKQLCLESRKLISSRREDERAKAQSFLDNIRGIFYYGVPHHGSPLVSPQAAERNSPLLEYFRTLNTEAERLKFEFDGLCRSYPKWQVGGESLGESLPTKSFLYQDVVEKLEASLREGDFYIAVGIDDICISKPNKRFYAFTGLLATIARNLENEGTNHEEVVFQEAGRPFLILGFGHLATLNHLEFYHWKHLQTLHDSFGQLATLNHLEFHHCWRLQTLCDSFGQLATLNHLEFHNCYELQTLPDSFGHLATLNHLEFHDCWCLPTLPDSFGQLATLKHLEFHDCRRLQTLPDSFGQLATLNHLEFHNCDELQTLPDSFGQLATLNHLEFHHCWRLQILPDSFGQLATLNHLEFHNCFELQTLPDSFGHLATLNHLEFHHCWCLPTLPDSFGQLATLNHLEFHHCKHLQTLPESFGQLATLNHLVFHHCSCLQTLPDSFGHLTTLNYLEFHNCKKLQTLPDSFGHLAAIVNHLEFHNYSKLQTLLSSGHLVTVNHVLKGDYGDTQSKRDWEQKLKCFITKVTDEGANGYFVSKIWLSSLDEHHREEVMSVLGGAGYLEIYQTRTTMFYEKIEDEIQASTTCNDLETDNTKATTYLQRIQSHFANSQTNEGVTFSKSNKGNVVAEAESSIASEGSGASLRDDLQSMGIADKISGVKIAIEAIPEIEAKCECPLQLLTVSCTKTMRSQARLSTSSSQVECNVTVPDGKLLEISTGVDKDISMETFDYSETRGHSKVDVPLNVSAHISLSCCVTSDQKNVRIHILEIQGVAKVGESFDKRTNALVLKSVRTNVDAWIKKSPVGSKNIRLNIKEDNCPPPWRRVLHICRPLDNNGKRKGPEDLMWLDLTGEHPKNSRFGSKTLELQHHVKNRLKIDFDEDSHRALILYFDGSLPVTFEGDILVDLDPNSFLELHVRHEVAISYNVPCDPRPTVDAISTFTRRKNENVEFDCVLEFRTQTFCS